MNKGPHHSNTFSKVIKEFCTDMNFSLAIAVFLLCLILSIQSEYFLSVNNFMNIGLYAAVIGIMAAGLTVSMLMGAFDISQYSVAALAGISIALLEKHELPVGMLIFAALLVGVICGVINGTLVTVFRINPIITTLGTMMIFRGFCYILTSSKILYISNKVFSFIGRGYFWGIPISLVILIAVYAGTGYMLKYTAFGRKVYCVGANPEASYLAGININKTRMWGLIFSSVMASIAGIISASQVGAAIPTSGLGAEMEIPAAVLLGGISLAGGKGKLSGTFLGLLILVIISNGLTLLSVQSYYQMLIRGLVLILAVAIDSFKGGGYK